MASIEDALRHAAAKAARAPSFSLPSAPPPSPSPAAVEVEPCTDAIASRCGGLVALFGVDRAITLVQTQMEAAYGRDRRAGEMNRAIASKLQSLPRGKVREIEEKWGGPQERGTPLFWHRGEVLGEETLDLVLDALTSGSYAAWEAAERQAGTAASWPALPSVEELAAEPAKILDRCRAWNSAYEAWAESRSDRELRALQAPSRPWDLAAARIYEAVAAAAEPLKRKAREEAVRLLFRFEAGEIPFAETASTLAALAEAPVPWWNGGCALGTGWSLSPVEVARLQAASPRWWEEGTLPPHCSEEGERYERPHTPPQGWAALSPEAWARHWRGGSTQSALCGMAAQSLCEAALATHGPGKGLVIGDVWVDLASCEIHYISSHDRPAHIAPGAILPCAPSPEGWLSSKGGCWATPRDYAALSRVLARAERPGNLDVSRVLPLYGRHAERGFPRLATKAWKTWVTVGVADSLGTIFDDLVVADRLEVLPPDCFRIHGSARPTSTGGWRIEAGNAPTPTVLLEVRGGEHSMGRHGWKGDSWSPKTGTRALHVSASGGSHGGGMRATVILAAITADTPLLLNEGPGFRVLPGGFEVRRVVGLATGSPVGEGVPV